ncbi:MAG: hypothetical protein ACJ76Y_11365 [Thermoanaerobaculia bacterium]
MKRVEAVEEWLKRTAHNIITGNRADTAKEEFDPADPFAIGCLFLLIAPVLILGWLVRYWLWGDIIWKNWKYGKPLLWLDLVSTLGSFLLLLLVIPLTIAMATRIARKLEGSEKLRGMLVALGIICFIIGNLLQLVATF